MYAGGLISSQTTGSMVVQLKNGNICIWATGSSLPCISLYKPLWFTKNAELYYDEKQQAEAVEHWRYIEAFHRMVLTGRIKDIGKFTAKRDAVENELFTLAETAGTDEEKVKVMKYAYEQENTMISEMLQQFGSNPTYAAMGGLHYRRYWRKQNKAFQLDHMAHFD